MKPSWLSGGRIPSLDGLRGISILLVTVCHIPAMAGAESLSAMRPYLVHGNLGVDVFFVISGFLITHLLLSEQGKHSSISLRGFYWRRTLRIFPAYYAFLCAAGALWAARLVKMDWLSWAASVTYTVDFMRDPSPYPIGHLWSLGVEEKFYLLWPSAMILAGRRNAVGVLLACLVICPILRFIGWEYWRPYVDIDLFFPTRMDTLAVGCLLAYFVRTDRAAMWSESLGRFATPIVLASAAVVILSAIVLGQSGKYTLGPKRLIEATAIAMIVFLATTQTDSLAAKVLNWRPLAFIGVLSYSLYLAQAFFFLNWDVSPWVKMAVALGYALASYYLIELPFLRLKGHPNK